ncbi:hypothetical protein RUMHYD_03195 [Blautia hydrogenotrophica DSM 10507]|uniref:Uncharacterized protein n=1 Tax=Blautia hydrogenotrophica (strain DSM 10507 / JCM 14656 / S5a33) TaxID=476272 RepID=C0CQN2_BLAHS|nr:hypothetical protein RUMHYD_03195 [Blautia hydrogenotrophica DSM 10507]
MLDNQTVAKKGTHQELMAQAGTYRDFVRIREEVEGDFHNHKSSRTF